MRTLLSLSLLVTFAGAAAAAPFSGEITTDAETGWKIVVLTYQDKDPAKSLQARIVPEVGANLLSLKVGEDELLHQPEKLADLKQHRAGTPIMFPTPNRVRDAKMTFEGREFTFEANNQKNFIHGLVRQRPWTAAEPKSTGAAASVDVSIDWNEKQPDWSRFPIAHRLTVTYTLRRDGVRIAYAVQNQSDAKLPFGFGLHPWFRLTGARSDVFIQVPVAHRMEAEEKLPTGKLLPVAGTPFDLRKPVSVDKLNLDDVYFGTKPSAAPAFQLRDKGLEVRLVGSKEFTHAVVFTPPDRPVFCVENQTSSTDAHNLFAKGLKKEANLLVVAPGKTARGHVDWKITRVRK